MFLQGLINKSVNMAFEKHRIYLSKLYMGTYYDVQNVIKYIHIRKNAKCVQAAVLTK